MSPQILRTAFFVALTPALGWTQLGAPPVPPENPITESKRILGKALFWEEQLSSENTMACGTCHFPSMGGSDSRLGPGSVHPGLNGSFGDPDDKVASPGVIHSDSANEFVEDSIFGFSPQVTTRRAPSHIGAAYFEELFWDGRARGNFVDPETGTTSIVSGGALESQAVGPIVNSVEMAHEGRTWDDVRVKLTAVTPMALASNLPADLAARLASAPSYPELFADAFGDPAINAKRIAFAIATYQRTLVPDDTLWDRFAAGDNDALNAQQQQGLADFTGAGRCVECHVPPLFSDDSFRNIGNRPIAEDSGRQGVTGNIDDRGRFQVPSLRNVSLRGRAQREGLWRHPQACLPLARQRAR